MFRTQVYLTEAEREGLQSLASQQGASQSELIRKAIDLYIDQHQRTDWKEKLLSLAGCLADKTDWADYEAIRREGDRELNR